MQTSSFLGEMMGTLVLILLGNGVVANVVLDKSKGQNSGWIVITAGWAFAVVMGIFVAQKFGSDGAHLNPAVTLAMAIKSGDWSFVPTCILAQMLGAVLGSVLVWLVYLPHWAETRDQSSKLAVFCTAPAVRNTTANLLTEIIGTMLLIIGVVSIYAGEKTGVGPFLVGILVWAIGLSLGGPTGYAINPARDLGPRIAHALLPIAGKGGSDWGYSWIPVVGPLVGALLAGGFLKMFGF
jgi:glycerol uptake facilitator protein